MRDLFLCDDLLKLPPFDYDEREKTPGGTFYNAVLEEIMYHYDNNILYHRFCMNKKFNPHEFNGDLSEIPPVQVSVFKELGRSLNSVPAEKIKMTLQSSATSGVPSSVVLDNIKSFSETCIICT